MALHGERGSSGPPDTAGDHLQLESAGGTTRREILRTSILGALAVSLGLKGSARAEALPVAPEAGEDTEAEKALLELFHLAERLEVAAKKARPDSRAVEKKLLKDNEHLARLRDMLTDSAPDASERPKKTMQRLIVPEMYCSPEKMMALRQQFLKENEPAISIWSAKFLAVFSRFFRDTSAEKQSRFFAFAGAIGLFNSFDKIHCHGVVARVLAEAGLYKERMPGNLRSSIRTADFLPVGDNVSLNEIDPIQGSFDATHQELGGSWWAREGAQRAFRECLNDPAVRQLLAAEPGLALAGAFSLVKAVIKYREQFNDLRPSGEILKQLLAERADFSKETLIDERTTVIAFHGLDTKSGANQFTAEDMRAVAEACGARYLGHETAKDKLAVESSKTPEAGPDSGSPWPVPPEPPPLSAIDRAIMALSDEPGPLFCYVDTHGGPGTLYTNTDESTVLSEVPVERIALALMQRAFLAIKKYGDEEGHRRALRDVTLVASSCYSYDFLFINLLPAMKRFNQKSLREKYGQPLVDFSRLELPRLISIAQEGTVGYAVVASTLRARTQALPRGRHGHRIVRGKDLLAAEPAMYRHTDLTVSSVRPGAIYQISSREAFSGESAQVPV